MTIPITTHQDPNRWTLDDKQGIVWNVAQDDRLPHTDHIEMSGRKVSLIVRYRVDKRRHPSLEREIIWPMLRHRKDDVRGYLRRTYGDDVLPKFVANDELLKLGPLASVRFDGVLTFEYQPVHGLTFSRTLFPSPVSAIVIEHWCVRNTGRKPIGVAVMEFFQDEIDRGDDGDYALSVRTAPSNEVLLNPNDYARFETQFEARVEGEKSGFTGWGDDIEKRRRFVGTVFRNLRLETPDPILNRAFDFAKLRAAESVFATKMGLVHSPGGGRYYGGVWANDQAEYSGPSFRFSARKRRTRQH